MATKENIVNLGNYRGHNSVCPVLGWNLDVVGRLLYVHGDLGVV